MISYEDMRFDEGLQTSHSAPPTPPLKSSAEELTYLQHRVEHKRRELGVAPTDTREQERIARRELATYDAQPDETVLDAAFVVAEEDVLHEKLRLEKEPHDQQVDALLREVPRRGIKNTLALARKIGSAHLVDDVHRALVQYVLRGLPGSDIPRSSELWRALHMRLYEVWLSDQDAKVPKEQAGDLAKLVAAMEQFYLGMLAMSDGQSKRNNIFTVEVAKPQGTEAVSFFVAVPTEYASLFEKHILSIFSNVRIEEQRGDYNIFTYGGMHVGASAALERHPAYPLKTYEDFTHDPMNVLLAAFSRLAKHDEGAALQIVIGNAGETYNRHYKRILDNLQKGYKPAQAFKRATVSGKVLGDLTDTLKLLFFDIKPNAHGSADQLTAELIQKKLQSRIVPVNMRIVASAKEGSRAATIQEEIASAFQQLQEPQGNGIDFHVQTPRQWSRFLERFVYRMFDPEAAMPLSVKELTTIYHLTAAAVDTSRELKRAKAKGRPAPIEVSEVAEKATTKGGTIRLGVNRYGGSETPVFFLAEDRLRHFYEIGQTGTGKTYLMKSMIVQDIYNGDGVCYIDPHGSDVQDILSFIPPERYKDVIYFDPAYIARPMGLNMFEYDPAHPEQKSFVVDEMLAIFEKLFGAVPESLGPMFQQYFRNAALLIVDDPYNIGTIADVPRVMADKAYRHELLARTQNPLVKQFWQSAEATSGEQALENFVPYITSKTDIFLANEFVRPIVAQQKSAFRFEDIMNERKIFLVNLSKGRLGELNANLLGLVIVGKFLQAAFSRVDMPEEQRAPFFLYIDEFQNFTTPSIATILSEARKYKLSLNIAHQFLAQLDEQIRDAVFGNVGTKCVFRVGTEDGEFFEKVLAPDISAQDVTTQENRHAYLSLLVNGVPVKPFPMHTVAIDKPQNHEQVAMLKQQSYERYGRPREEVEEEIRRKYLSAPKKEQPFPDLPGF